MNLRELKREYAQLVEQGHSIVTAAFKDGRTVMSAEELEKWEKIHTDAEALRKTIEAVESQQVANERANQPVIDPATVSGGGGGGSGRRTGVDPELARLARHAWMRFGPEAMSEEERTVGGYVTPIQLRELLTSNPEEARALSVTTTGGGYLIDSQFQADLDKVMIAFGGVRRAARVITTSTGAVLEWPTVDDASNVGELLGINIQVNEQDVAFAQKVFEAYKYSSKAVRVPVELLQDSAFNIDELLSELLGERLGRITSQHLTTGDGSSKPNGLVTAATASGITMDISTGLTYDNIIDFEHTVNSAYRGSPKVAWMFSDVGMKLIKKVLDLNGRPMFRAANEAPGSIATLDGYPIQINDDMPTPLTTTNVAWLFGDFGKYIVRVVRPMVMVRVVERYADYHQVGFFAFERLDGELLNAAAVKSMDVVT